MSVVLQASCYISLARVGCTKNIQKLYTEQRWTCAGKLLSTTGFPRLFVMPLGPRWRTSALQRSVKAWPGFGSFLEFDSNGLTVGFHRVSDCNGTGTVAAWDFCQLQLQPMIVRWLQSQVDMVDVLLSSVCIWHKSTKLAPKCASTCPDSCRWPDSLSPSLFSPYEFKTLAFLSSALSICIARNAWKFVLWIDPIEKLMFSDKKQTRRPVLIEPSWTITLAKPGQTHVVLCLKELQYPIWNM